MTRPACFARISLVAVCLAAAVPGRAAAESVDRGSFGGEATGRIFSKVVDEAGNTQFRTETWLWNVHPTGKASVELTMGCPSPDGVEVLLKFDDGVMEFGLERTPNGFSKKLDAFEFRKVQIIVRPGKPNVADQTYRLSGRIVGAGVPATPPTATPPTPQPAPVPAGPSTLEDGIDRVGSDYQKLLGVKDAQSCRANCEAAARCQAYSWVKANGDCYLKDPAPKPTPGSCCVSGAKGAAAPKPADLSMALTLEDGVDRVGSDYAKLPGFKDATACRARCEGDARCKAYAFVKGNGDCYLKDPAPKPTPGACCVSGAKGAAALSLEDGVDRVGSDYAKLPGFKDASACRARCEGDARCKAYAFVKGNGDCYLKDPAPKATAGACCVSGARAP